MRSRGIGDGVRACRVVLLALAAAGCGAAGPEVRVTADPLDWAPARVAVLPAAAGTNCVPPAAGLPPGVAPPDAASAPGVVLAAVRQALAGCATRMSIEPAPAPGTTGAAEAVDRLGRQYLDARDVDPRLVRAVGDALPGTEALLLTALLRYGPEADTDVASSAQNVNTTVGAGNSKTDLAISSAATHVSVWFAVQFRVCLVRCRDGALLWDVAERRKVKRSLLRDVTLESVLADAARDLCPAFPWRAEEAGPAQAPPSPDPPPGGN
jgi:hypothetical protein